MARLAPYRPRVATLLGVAAVVLPLACLVASVVIRDWAAQRFLFLYAAPLLLAVPLWARLRLATLESSSAASRLLDVLVLALGLARFVGAVVPLSGHMLFLTYSGLTTPIKWYRWVVVVLLAETTVFKLILWQDAWSWGLGLGVGLLAATIYGLLRRGQAV